jgi:site-specific recombinase XerD
MEGEDFPSCKCRKHLRWSMGGKQYRRKAGTRNWKGAVAEANKLIAELVKSDEPEKVIAKSMGKTLAEAQVAFLKSRTVREIRQSTNQKYTRDIKRLVDFCEARNVFTVDALDTSILLDYKATWPALYSSSATRYVTQLSIRVFLNFCHRSGWLIKVPYLDPVQINSPKTTPLTEGEYAKVLNATKDETTRAIIQLMRWTGLAIFDASHLRRDELVCDGKKKRAYVSTDRQKTGVAVRVPLRWDIAKDILAAARKKGDYLFYDGNAKPTHYAHNHGRNISAIFEDAGVTDECHMVSHRLRDTFAVHLLSHGVPMEEVSKLLGHKSISTTEKHYSMWVQGRQDRVDQLVAATW